jgi:DNA-binding transcriptional LysR family regulator
MDVYKRLALLVTVVDTGSMTRAARELRLTPSAVSQQMRRLERDVQLAIFRRSAGRLLLTSAGEALYEGGVAMLAATRSAAERLAELRDRPAGELCVGLSPRLAVRQVLGALEPMLETYPELTVRVIVSDTPDTLLEARSDLIVWAGDLPSSSDVVGHVGDWEQIVCGSPAYLARRGVPETPDDLAAHDFVGSGAGQIFVDFVGASGEHEAVRLNWRIAGNGLAAADLAAAGFGLAVEALPGVAASLASGALVRVLADWRLPPLPIVVLMPARTRQPAKVRHAVDALRRGLGADGPAGVPAGTSA